MFIRKRHVTGPNGYRYTYYAIVETVRIDGKPRQKLLYNMSKLKTIAECIKREQKKLDRYRPEDDAKRAANALMIGLRLPPTSDAQMRAKYQKRIDFLKDAATQLGE